MTRADSPTSSVGTAVSSEGFTRSPFRRDIQALRAVAVGLVLLNHLWPERVPGGYIGVDVFFVISGYLITAHLRREVDLTGRVKLAVFWARRAKRLLPAAMVALFFSALVAAIWLPITNRQSAFDQIGAAGTYVVNWALAASSLNYFAQGSAESPVTHYWSLSVEEQFYLVWPLLILLCLLLTRRRSRWVRDATIVLLFATVFVASLLWGIRASITDPSAAYFQTTGRAWEFAVGGLLAYLPSAPRRFTLWLVPVSWAGWAVLAISAFRFNGSSGFPGQMALVPIVATAVLIWVGDLEHPWAPSGLTSFEPVQFLGGISYSLYLWHWPLIIAAPFVLHREIYARDKVAIVCIAVLVAYLSRRFVEDPVRRSKFELLRRPRYVLIGTAATMVLLLAVTVPASAQINSRAHAAAKSLYEQSLNPGECFGAQAVLSGANCPQSHTLTAVDTLLLTNVNQLQALANGSSCQEPRGSSTVNTCSFGVRPGTQVTNVALIGDSHAGMWAPTLSAIAEQRGLRVTTYLASSCSATADPAVIYGWEGTHHEECRKWRESAIARIAADKDIDVVVTSSIDRRYLGAPDDNGIRAVDTGDGYVGAWTEWLKAGKRVVVIDEVPERDSLIPQCLAVAPGVKDACAAPAPLVSERGPLERAAAQIHDSNFTFVNFLNVFCGAKVCHSIIGGIPVYIDTNHLTAPFARSFASEFLDIAALRPEAG